MEGLEILADSPLAAEKEKTLREIIESVPTGILIAGNYTEVMDSLERMERAYRRMHILIDDLLQLSRVGRIELQMKATDLGEIVQEVREDLEDKLKENKVTLEISSQLPRATVDRKRIYQVFENLIENAIKYASDVPNPLIRIICKEDRAQYLVAVKDNGNGIEKQYHKKIFGLFQRLQTEKEGTGVGLTIVSKIMQLHKGHVWVESAPGAGAEFWLAFPKTSNRPDEVSKKTELD